MKRKMVKMPVDGLAGICVLLAYIMCYYDYQVPGGILAIIVFVLYLLYLGIEKNPSLLYQPKFSHWYYLLAAWAAILIFSKEVPVIQAVATGAMVYHYTCICLHERTLRYVPWATGLNYKTIRDTEGPYLFWSMIGLFSIMGVGLLMLPFISMAISGIEPQ